MYWACAILNDTATAVAVLVLKRAVNHVGESLESTVWVPRRAFRFEWKVFNFAHLIHVNKRVDIGVADAGERSG
jgi:hypothetical protein